MYLRGVRVLAKQLTRRPLASPKPTRVFKLLGGEPPESDGEPRTEPPNLESSRGQETLREISGEVGTILRTSSTKE